MSRLRISLSSVLAIVAFLFALGGGFIARAFARRRESRARPAGRTETG